MCIRDRPYLPPMSRYLAAGVDYGTTNATAAVLLGVTAERLSLIHI